MSVDYQREMLTSEQVTAVVDVALRHGAEFDVSCVEYGLIGPFRWTVRVTGLSVEAVGVIDKAAS